VPPPADQDDERDRVLLKSFVDGDAAAFGELVERHTERLWPVAVRMCSWRESDAEDALQEAFLSAMRGAGGFRGDARVSTWLHRIVVNACLDRARRRQRRPEVGLPEEMFALADPRDRIGERELAWEVERALADLPPEQRAAVILVDVEGWPVAEAGELLGVPVGTVKSRAARGRAKLAEALAHRRNRPPAGSVEDGMQGRPASGTGER
jgi:RNA polymerase sigma-70 factor (ECF subfamily)